MDTCSQSDHKADHILVRMLSDARRGAGFSRRALAMSCALPKQRIKRLEDGIGSLATLYRVMSALDFRLVGLPPGATLHEQLKTRRLAVPHG